MSSPNKNLKSGLSSSKLERNLAVSQGRGDLFAGAPVKKPAQPAEQFKSACKSATKQWQHQSVVHKCALPQPNRPSCPVVARKSLALMDTFDEKPCQFAADVQVIKVRATGTLVDFIVHDSTLEVSRDASATDSETASLMSKGSLDEYEKPFYSKNDWPITSAVQKKRYHARRRHSQGSIGFDSKLDTVTLSGNAASSFFSVPEFITYYRPPERAVPMQQRRSRNSSALCLVATNASQCEEKSATKTHFSSQRTPAVKPESSSKPPSTIGNQKAQQQEQEHAAIAQTIAQSNHASMVTQQSQECPRFVPITRAALINDPGSLLGIPVGVLNVFNNKSRSMLQLPVYVVQQRLGLLATNTALISYGLLCAGQQHATIVEAIRDQSYNVNVHLVLFQANLLTPKEKAYFPLPLVSNDEPFQVSCKLAPINITNKSDKLSVHTATATTPVEKPQFYQEQIEVFAFFDQFPLDPIN